MRKLLRKKADPERAELKGIIRMSNISPPIKALAIHGVSLMSREQVSQALAVAPVLMAAVKNDDREGVLQVLRDQQLDEVTIADMMKYYDQIAGLDENRRDGNST